MKNHKKNQSLRLLTRDLIKIHSEDEIVENLKKCPHFDFCSRNLCPLDLELQLRTGGLADKCRYMRDAKASKINGRDFVSGGTAMPDAILNFVPRENLRLLNRTSQKKLWDK